MMMQMLEAGGVEVVSDDSRPADRFNPRGYHDFEFVRGLTPRPDWLGGCEGRAIKVVAPLLHRLPKQHRYRVILMDRDLGAVVASQNALLGRATEPVHDCRMGAAMMLVRERAWAHAWRSAHMEVCEVSYESFFDDAVSAGQRVHDFLQCPDLDAVRMCSVFEDSLCSFRGPLARCPHLTLSNADAVRLTRRRFQELGYLNCESTNRASIPSAAYALGA